MLPLRDSVTVTFKDQRPLDAREIDRTAPTGTSLSIQKPCDAVRDCAPHCTDRALPVNKVRGPALQFESQPCFRLFADAALTPSEVV